jgi:transcriptional regulator with XRE-family HTH domain
MDEVTSWRRYLHEIVRLKSAAEKKQLCEAVQVTRTAFQRWRTGENTPDAAHIVLLLKALSQEESERLHALMLEDPKVRPLLPADLFSGAQAPEKIPQEVYEEVFRIARDTSDRFWLLCSTIFFRALIQLETHPKQTGVEVSVARCMPAHNDGKVRSLREYAGRGTPPWRGDLHIKDWFLGAESLAGYAVMQRHGVMVSDRSNSGIVMPAHWMEHEMSCAAYPILREGCIAGALIVSSAVPNFFSQEKLLLIERYADLLRLAFYDHEFVPASSIELGLMPPWTIQQRSFASFRQRVQEEYKRSLREDQPLQELAQVEERVRAMLEQELLVLARQADKDLLV